VFVTSIKTGAVFVPILFFAPEGTMSQYGLASLDEARSFTPSPCCYTWKPPPSEHH
jgi:hypothetical protein